MVSALLIRKQAMGWRCLKHLACRGEGIFISTNKAFVGGSQAGTCGARGFCSEFRSLDNNQ